MMDEFISIYDMNETAQKLHIEWAEDFSLAEVLRYKNLPYQVYNIDGIPVDPFQNHIPAYRNLTFDWFPTNR